jgi:predicted nucleotide-binding protein
MLRLPRPTVAELLAKSVEEGEALLERASLIGDVSDYESWKATRKLWSERTAETLIRIYEGSEESDRFRDAASTVADGQPWQVEYRRDSNCVRDGIDVLASFRDRLEAEPAAGPEIEEQPAASELEQESTEARLEQASTDRSDAEQTSADISEHAHDQEPAIHTDLQQEPAAGTELEPEFAFSNGSASAGSASALPVPASGAGPMPAGQVFVVHGRDETLKEAVAELLERAGSHEVTIVNERPSDRRMLVERFDELASESRYAVVLLTADDVGAPRLDSEREPYYSPRARQGVVFEMGILVAALTPRCMCVLYEDGVELPFDMDGIAYVRLDLAGTWQSKLLLHMRNAGFDYDLNRLAPI